MQETLSSKIDTLVDKSLQLATFYANFAQPHKALTLLDLLLPFKRRLNDMTEKRAWAYTVLGDYDQVVTMCETLKSHNASTKFSRRLNRQAKRRRLPLYKREEPTPQGVLNKRALFSFISEAYNLIGAMTVILLELCFFNQPTTWWGRRTQPSRKNLALTSKLANEISQELEQLCQELIDTKQDENALHLIHILLLISPTSAIGLALREKHFKGRYHKPDQDLPELFIA